MRRNRAAFTLVELLVVIGIIAILIGILFSVIAGVRRQAQQAGCTANLRAIGQAMAAYTMESGCYPGCHAMGVNSGNFAMFIWQTRLRQTMGGRSEASERAFHCPARPAEGLDFFAPGEPTTGFGLATGEHRGFGDVVDEPLYLDYSGGQINDAGVVVRENETRRFYSYGLNRIGTDPGQGLGFVYDVRGRPREVPVTRVKMPAEMIAITDAGLGPISKYQATIQPDLLVNPVGNLHRGGANVLWCDGHVDWQRTEEITFTHAEGNYAARAPKYFRVAPLWNSSHKALPNG